MQEPQCERPSRLCSMALEVHIVRGVEITLQRNTETYPQEYWRMASEGIWEQETLDFIDWLGQQEEPALLDVGAASGIVTLYALGRGIPVLSVEPSIPDYAALQANLASRATDEPKVLPRWAVVGDIDGTLTYADDADPGLLAPITFREGTQNADVSVPVVPLSKLILDVLAAFAPRLIAVKIDVEGAEFRILTREALESLRANSCVLELSVHPGAPGSAPIGLLPKALWRARVLREVIGLVARIRRHAKISSPERPGQQMNWWATLRRLDGPDKTLLCDFR